MGERLRHLILEAWEHDHLPGPLTDLDLQQRQREEWVATLTAADCLLMLSWLAAPVIPESWGVGSGWHQTLISGVPYYVGGAGRRLDDPRIRSAVAGLIGQPSSRRVGLLCAQELRHPELFPLILSGLRGGADRCDEVLALARCASPEQIEAARQRAAFPAAGAGERAVMDEVVFEWQEARRERADAEPGAAADPPKAASG